MTSTTWKSGPTQAPLPPLMPGLPVVGNALTLSQNVSQFLLKGYHRYGPIFRIRALGDTYTVIAGTDANLFFSREKGEHLRSKEFWAGIDQEMKANITVISSDGPDHSELRQISKRGYSRSLYESHFPEVLEINRRMIDAWPVGESRAVVPWVQSVVIEQLGQVIVGTAPGDYGKDIYNFIRTALLVLITRQRPGFLLRMPAYKNARRRSFELATSIVDYHIANPPVDRLPNLIDDALAAAQEGNVLSEQDLVPFALGPLYRRAGHLGQHDCLHVVCHLQASRAAGRRSRRGCRAVRRWRADPWQPAARRCVASHRVGDAAPLPHHTGRAAHRDRAV